MLLYQKHKSLFPHKCQLDFDEQGRSGDFAIEWYGRLKSIGFPPEYRQIMEGTPRMLDDRSYPPLRAADMLAWSIRRSVITSNDNSGWEWLFEELHQTMWGRIGIQDHGWKHIMEVLKLSPST
jgi:hypothetical protein